MKEPMTSIGVVLLYAYMGMVRDCNWGRGCILFTALRLINMTDAPVWMMAWTGVLLILTVTTGRRVWLLLGSVDGRGIPH